MRRRPMLVSLGVATLTPLTAGCLSQRAVRETLEDRDTTDGDETASGNESDNRYVLDDDETHHHQLTVRNEDEEERTVELRVDTDGERRLETSHDLSADEEVVVVLAENRSFDATVKSGSATAQFTITHQTDGCAESESVVTITDAGINTQQRTVQGGCYW